MGRRVQSSRSQFSTIATLRALNMNRKRRRGTDKIVFGFLSGRCGGLGFNEFDSDRLLGGRKLAAVGVARVTPYEFPTT